jgi:hypothetical protein
MRELAAVCRRRAKKFVVMDCNVSGHDCARETRHEGLALSTRTPAGVVVQLAKC